jgi:hypothetical protein
VSPLRFTPGAETDLAGLKNDKGLAKQLRAVNTALGYLEANPRHPGLNSHEFNSLLGANGEKVFEVYAENATAAAYRIFWHYGPNNKEITILAITSHP